MTKIENVEVYDNDEEIVEILLRLPKMKEYDNKNILEFMGTNTEKLDFGTIFFEKDMVYVIYKLDKHLYKLGDAGLIMTISHKDFVLEQLNIWKKFKETGMDLSDKILQMFDNFLTASFAVQIVYRDTEK
jgi:hypothetical protein